MSAMAGLPSCSCCAYAAIKQVVRARIDEYESIMYKFKAAERQMDKIEAQITVIREDIERKSDNAARSPMLRGGKERELTELSQEFSDLVDGYGEMHVNLGCPCCRGVPNAKKAAREMMEAADELRESFTEGPNMSPMPHSVISARRELYEEKAYEACELRKEAVERLLFFVGESKEFLASFQSLQEQFHRMMESISMHNALMLLGEESVSSTAKRGKREGKRLKDAAAKTDSKGRKAAAPKKAAEHKQEATKDQSSVAAAPSGSDEEGAYDEEAALEPAVTHNNPFAALNGEEDSKAAEQAAESANSDSSSERSASTSAGVEQHVNSSTSPGDRHEHAEFNLPAQRQAILARIRGSKAGALELANGKPHRGMKAQPSKGHAAKGQLGSGQLGYGELGTAEQLRAKLGDSLLAYELVGHLCCPITEELIQDPVVAMDGLTYERTAILDWFVERPAGFSYLTKQRLPSKFLLPNKDYKSLVVQLIS